MSVSSSGLRDPEPFLGQRDLAGLDWQASWEYLSTATTDDDWDAAGGEDLDVELRPLLESTQSRVAPLTGWSDAAIVAEVARLERLTRWASARGYELINELAQRRPDPSGSPDERGLSAYALDEIAVAVATGISRWSACRRVAEADALTHQHTQLLVALSSGCLSVPAVQRVLEATAVLDPEGCGTVERRLLDRAGRPALNDLGASSPEELDALTTEQVMGISAKATPASVGRVARELARRVDPTAARRRELKAKADRSVRLELASDGMAWLSSHLPADAAVAAYEHVDALAHALPTDVDGEPDSRSMDAKRADVLTSLLLGAAVTPDGTVTAPAPVNVHVIVDGRTARTDGATGLPGEIARLGSVTAETLRDLLDLTEQTAGTMTGGVAVDETPRIGHPRRAWSRPLRPTRATEEPAPRPAPHLRLPRLLPPITPVRARPHAALPGGTDLHLQPRAALQAPPQPQAPRPRLATHQPR